MYVNLTVSSQSWNDPTIEANVGFIKKNPKNKKQEQNKAIEKGFRVSHCTRSKLFN
jgi:hypothetical protein